MPFDRPGVPTEPDKPRENRAEPSPGPYSHLPPNSDLAQPYLSRAADRERQAALADAARADRQEPDGDGGDATLAELKQLVAEDEAAEAKRQEQLAEGEPEQTEKRDREDDQDDRPESGTIELGGPRSKYDASFTEEQRQERISELMPNAEKAFDSKSWSNKHRAGSVFYDYPDQMLRSKYPDGVPFSYEGCPQFEQYAIAKVELRDGFKNRPADFAEADELAGFEKRPRGTTWHHHEDGKTMVLMSRDLHQTVRHWGGIRTSEIKNQEGSI